jgi:glycoside hydrolase-like protein
MTAWGSASPYHAVGIYIGGTNMACSQPNLTSSWVSAEAAAGWYLVPIYVGLQSPSSSCGCSTIAPKQAASQGTAAARDAVTQAQAVGLGPGTPIYFDMEGYTPGGKNTNTVLTFLTAWTAQLHAAGYVSGVYSSGASGIADLVASSGTSYLEPDDIWIADWNGAQTTSDPYVPAADWANHQRLHQYSGGHNETYGHVTINIDGNYLDVQTSGTWTPPPDGTYVQEVGASSIYRLAGGAPLYVSNWTAMGGLQSFIQVTPQQFRLLRRFPLGGTFLQTSAGGLYRVAGGAPLWVSSWTVFGGPQPYVAIDQWDIDNITNPLAHLRTVPANGTWLTTPAGQIYRVAGGTPFPIASWTPYGGLRPSVMIDPWDVQNISSPQSHLLATPLDGTVVEGLPSATYWLFKGGKRQQVGPTRGAVRVDDAAIAPFRILVMCVVPRLQNLTLGQAKRRLHRSHCRLGKVSSPTGAAHALRIIRQWPRPHTNRQRGYRVKVTVG